MSFQVVPPQFDASKKCYTFTFVNAPRIEQTTKDPSKLTLSDEDLSDLFIREFLQQASKYFSKVLDLPVFYKRATYEWITEEVDFLKILEKGENFRAIWIPAKIMFYSTRYEVCFTLVELEPVVTSAIPPGFLQELDVPGEEIALVNLISELPELPIAEITQEIIPYGEITEEEKAKREAARKHIRQARLRASLARLRAEKLADRYYRRYGNFEMEGSESDLTSEEES